MERSSSRGSGGVVSGSLVRRRSFLPLFMLLDGYVSWAPVVKDNFIE
jgi:hypothetical protein